MRDHYPFRYAVSNLRFSRTTQVMWLDHVHYEQTNNRRGYIRGELTREQYENNRAIIANQIAAHRTKLNHFSQRLALLNNA